jgi:probable DNA metabolism protein
MTTAAFEYDGTFEGLLTAVFDAYSRKTFPDMLLKSGTVAPLFTEILHTVVSDTERSNRVMTALERKLPKYSCNMLLYVWLSETKGCDMLLFRYIRKIFDSKILPTANFGDNDVLEIRNLARKVAHEALYLKQFARFGKTADNLFYAPLSPRYNALPLTVDHFVDRFADQQWIIYDTHRKYGYYYDLHQATEISFADALPPQLDESVLAEDEKLFRNLWREYFKSLTIKERINPRLQRRNMPRRFWKYLTEISD